MSGTRIGLEVHVPLATRAKLFCSCVADGSEEANRNICPTCTGQPGARPRGVNARALRLAALAGRILGCTPNERPVFQRKHYVYPDLPNNFQRTSTPIGEDGHFWDVGILELHVEEDPGSYDLGTGLVDLDRSGTPLVEIVTAPDLTDPELVATWLRVLRLTLARAGVVRAGAELKADVNVSVRGGDRVEVKNVVGARNAARAAAHEVERQLRVLDAGETLARETRHFDETKGTTRASREKESVGDYRYQVDPDLLPLDMAAASADLPAHEDLPGRLSALMETHALALGEALALLEDAALDALFQDLLTRVPAELAVEVGLRRLRSELEYRKADLASSGMPWRAIVALAEAWSEEGITKQVFTRLLRAGLDGSDALALLEKELAAGEGIDLAEVVDAVIAANDEAVASYRGGKEGAINFLVGQVMARTKGRARADEVREALEAALAR